MNMDDGKLAELDVVSAAYDPVALTITLKLSREPFPEEAEEMCSLIGQINADRSMKVRRD